MALVGLTVSIALTTLWLRADPEPADQIAGLEPTSQTTEVPTTTVAAATAPTTSQLPTLTAATSVPVAARTVDDLRALAHASYLGWFDAIYRDDPVALARWVGTDRLYEDGLRVMEDDSIPFIREPTADRLDLEIEEVLLDRADCVVLQITDELAGFIEADPSSRTRIVVHWPTGDPVYLRMATVWAEGSPSAGWETDCDHRVRRPAP